MATVHLLFVILLQTSVIKAIVPVVYDLAVPPSSQCGQSNPFEDDQQLMEKLKMIHQQLPPPECNSPPSTCRDIHRCNSSASSGYYQIQAANGSAVQVYCDMEGTNCGGEGGWMRVAHLNMTDPSSQCPDDFLLGTPDNVRLCYSTRAACRIIRVESFGLSYSQVCGYARGISHYGPRAFEKGPNVLLSGNYVDGISITYGTPPTHIWTYAAGNVEVNNDNFGCPCNTNSTATSNVPQYVGSDYYCESGTLLFPGWYTSDPLWDGKQCGGVEGPCCNHTGLPWFLKTLSTSTTATITTRVCLNEDAASVNIGIENFELYVK